LTHAESEQLREYERDRSIAEAERKMAAQNHLSQRY
jgi:hypothetical protein